MVARGARVLTARVGGDRPWIVSDQFEFAATKRLAAFIHFLRHVRDHAAGHVRRMDLQSDGARAFGMRLSRADEGDVANLAKHSVGDFGGDHFHLRRRQGRFAIATESAGGTTKLKWVRRAGTGDGHHPPLTLAGNRHLAGFHRKIATLEGERLVTQLSQRHRFAGKLAVETLSHQLRGRVEFLSANVHTDLDR